MKIIETAIPGLMLLEGDKCGDSRGFFMELWREEWFKDAGITFPFMQENLALSKKNTVRGLHYQNPHGQGKLVSVLTGSIIDVVVDIRYGSPTFGTALSFALSADDTLQLFVPAGLAHGYCVTSNEALMAYKVDEYYHPECEAAVLWNDPDLAIEWGVDNPILSDKDKKAPCLSDIDTATLPRYE